MMDFLIYDVKVAVLIAVFYMFYRLMLAHETFHRVNRMVLLTTAVASFVLPLCVFTMHKTVMVDYDFSQLGELTVNEPVVSVMPTDNQPSVILTTVLPVLFIIGMLATLVHTLISLIRIQLLIHRSEKHPQEDGTVICVTGNTALSPFSWMHYIVMNRSDYEAHDAAILAHERGHIRLRHSWDLLFVDLLTALQWFNPAMWMLRSDLRAIHEYEADGEVLSLGINARQYQYLLISKAAGIGGYSLANGISHSTLKNRINMMLHKKSNRTSLLKLFALVPIVGITLALNARTVNDYVYDGPQKQNPVKKGKKNTTIKVGTQEIKVTEASKDDKATTVTMNVVEDEQNATDDKVFDVVENMPEFNGGMGALMQYLSDNIRYPEEKDIQGRVIVRFVVGKDGSISNAQVVKSVHPSFDAEALRIINNMPKWIPGTQNGKPVNVKYVVPINFKSSNANSATIEEPNAVGSFVTNEGNGNLKELQLRENDKKASKIVVAKGISLFGVDGQDIDIYVDGKLVEQDKIGTIKSDDIERIEIKGTKDTRKSIHVYMKKQ
ncbi:MAG: TonB family protein [Prevotella sp.]|nr:TonB family protein [Prevotella sp.]